ncbi:MAG: acetyl-CoA carboxylase biotin carboxylase subunit [Ectothiorhodospiraceae bacterium]|nr:acetyl-CoA carboxylase biotin carboxylase subunit [Ectothiorhodospiraceae bacterium]
MNTNKPFHKILIANRGEIAVRIMRSARALGYRTVAVYSVADERAPHVSAADEAVLIGDPQPAESYLRIDRVIEAARLSGADAVHPGYGFLAENPELPRACADAGLVFIGPGADAMAAMGDKAAAKALMMEAGVPCVPGYQGDDQDEQRMAEEAQRIGFPLMIKATAGGGGRGMRLVHDASAFPDALRSARSEAEAAFGNPTVILERAIVNPRHIEIQVLADRLGNVIHLGERDCSVQRRHQKVVEEAPSPAVDSDLRAAMGEAAVRAARAIGYEGAGTLEFLLDGNGEFYFMEMNTRLQVEHPVTEFITGLDLVELQLRIAAGEPLPLEQDAVCFDGHAIEVRLCAEDVDQGFMPQSGVMARWQAPVGVRVDHALHSGVTIPPYYDSMIAKVISHGRDRDEARRKLIMALEDMVALGVVTNQRFLALCLAHPTFAGGQATTAFVDNHQDELLAADEATEQRLDAVGAVLLFATHQRHADAVTLTHRLPVLVRFERRGSLRMVELVDHGRDSYTVTVDEQAYAIRLLEHRPDVVRFSLDGLVQRAEIHRDGDALHFQYHGIPVHLSDRTYAAATRDDEAGGDGKIRASMTGRVVHVQVQVGDVVTAGQPVLTLEAMKMEHVHVAPVAGKVVALNAGVGDQVIASHLVAEIELAEQAV